jgi:hypothetical protein
VSIGGPTQMSMGGSQDGVYVGELRIGFGSPRSEFDRLFVAPGQQCRQPMPSW